MNKRIVTVMAALMILMTAIRVPARHAYAEDPGADAASEDSGGGGYSGGNTPDGNTSGGSTPGENTSDGNTPGENTPDGNTSDGNTPGENTSDGNTSDGNTSDGNTSDGNTSDGNTSDGNTSDGNAPDENTTGGSVPDSDNPGGSSEGDDTEPETEPEPNTLSLMGLGLGDGGLGEDGLGGSGGGDILRFMWDHKDITCFVEAGTGPDELPLAPIAKGYLGWVDYVECDIDWHYADIDVNTPGRYLVTGDISVPDDYDAGNCDLTAQCVIIVYSLGTPPAVTAARVGNPLWRNIVPLNMGDADLIDFFEDEARIQPIDPNFDMEYVREKLSVFFLENNWSLPADPIGIETEYGDTCLGVLAGWDASLVDTSAAGAYYPFFVEPPPGVGFPGKKGPGADVKGAEVYVMDPDEVYLFAWDLDVYGFLRMYWLKEIGEPELWLSVDAGGWKVIDDYDGSCNWQRASDSYGNDQYNGLEIALNVNNGVFQSGHVYEIQVRYENDGVSADTLILDYTGGKPEFRSPGGDRTGGDREENTLPDTNTNDDGPQTESNTNKLNDTPVNRRNRATTAAPENYGAGMATPTSADTVGAQAAPPADPGNNATATIHEDLGNQTQAVLLAVAALPAGLMDGAADSHEPGENAPPPESSATEPAAGTHAAPPSREPAEYSDERSITVSGERLAVIMAAHPEHVPFLRGELRVLLPAPWLESLALGPTDTFTAALYQPDENSFALSFSVNGNLWTGRFDEPFLFSLPWSGGPVSCALKGGEITDAILEDGRAVFALYQTGVYELTEQAAAAAVFSQNAGNPAREPVQYSEAGAMTDRPSATGSYPGGWAAALAVTLFVLAGGGVVFSLIRKRPVKRP